MRIGIFDLYGGIWAGGEQYIRNLVLALKQTPGANPVLFLSPKRPAAEFAAWRALGCEALPLRTCNRWTPAWWFSQFAKLAEDARLDFYTEYFIRYNKIDVTYMRPCLGRFSRTPCISWIQDFQHVHLPEMFCDDEIARRNTDIRLKARYSTLVVLSSRTAYRDFSLFAPEYSAKGKVVHFVVSVDAQTYAFDPREAAQRYRLPDKFFYFPGQFWKHKNHLLVVKAISLLKDRGHQVVVVCSGDPKDYRHPGYWETLRKAICDHHVEDNMILLGMIPVGDILPLMRQSIAVVNPSLFEGWSTTVEEAKSLGKRVLLSDIPVHFEQDPPGGTFFERLNPEDLAEKMLELWRDVSPGPHIRLEKQAREVLPGRIRNFGSSFLEVASKTVKDFHRHREPFWTTTRKIFRTLK